MVALKSTLVALPNPALAGPQNGARTADGI
jgi:hypothetical protein